MAPSPYLLVTPKDIPATVTSRTDGTLPRTRFYNKQSTLAQSPMRKSTYAQSSIRSWILTTTIVVLRICCLLRTSAFTADSRNCPATTPFGAGMSRKCSLEFLTTIPLGRLTLLFLRTGWNTGASTEVRRFRDFDSSMSIHGFADITGEKLVDPLMYPGVCVDHCNKKGAPPRQRIQM